MSTRGPVQQARWWSCQPLPDNERVAIAVVGKFAMLCWHMLNKEEDDLWTHPALGANNLYHDAAAQQAVAEGQGNRLGPACVYYDRALREQEVHLDRQVERNYQYFADTWRPRPPANSTGRITRSST